VQTRGTEGKVGQGKPWLAWLLCCSVQQRGEDKLRVLEDTLLSENESRERAGLQREANRTVAGHISRC
jgi:hypothetical protein